MESDANKTCDSDAFIKHDEEFDAEELQKSQILHSIEKNNLINLLYDSLLNEKSSGKDKQMFEQMKTLIDQIYGVETEIIENSQKRFARLYMQKSAKQLFQNKSRGAAANGSNPEESKTNEKSIYSQLMLQTDDKVRLLTLS